MDEALKTTSTSPDSIFSELSPQDSLTNPHTASSLSSSASVYSPFRSSITLADISSAANTFEYDSFYDDFSSRRFSRMSRWQSDAQGMNLEFNSPTRSSLPRTTYPINDLLTNRNTIPSSIADALMPSMSRLLTSSSFMPFDSTTNQRSTNQQLSRSAVTNSTNPFTAPYGNVNPFLPPLSLLPLPTPSSHRQTLSAIDNISSATADNDLQQVPPFTQPSSTFGNTPIAHPHPQSHMVQSAGRSNSMPSWRGYLPIRFDPTTIDQHQMTTHFSQKVFLGGIPPELTEAELLLVLRRFGKCNIKWPKNDGVSHNMPGFCHVVFRESRSVCELLKHCTRQQRSTIDYFLHIHMSLTTSTTASGVPARTNRLKPIQVVPWNVQDNVFVMHEENISNGDASQRDWSRTIFVSPLHGKMTAFSLATIMSNVFGLVSMAQINTDRYGYPTGTGTVLFCDSHSYMRGVAAGAIDIKCDCFHKLLDIDPFLRENERCAHCSSAADLFCRNFHCLRSYCKQCWVNRHGPKPLADHQPATRRQQPLPHV